VTGGRRRWRGRVAVVVALGAVAALVPRAADAADGAPAARPGTLRVAVSDGVELEVHLSGATRRDGTLPARPTIVELSPYGQPGGIPDDGPAYNTLEVHLRGTGGSDGAFDALGPRTQQDVADILGWACRQPFSNGRLGLWGFSASAIVVYNALHLRLPCVEGAVLGAGTHELYRDLLYPGGVPNLGPALVVLAGIGGGSLADAPARLQRDPATGLETIGGMFDVGTQYLLHPTLDAWWRERGMRGNANDFPILMVTGVFDVESRGPFEVFRELRSDPRNHLYVVGAHDGVPAGTGGADAERRAWYDHTLRGVANGVDRHPIVQMWLSDGSREGLLAGDLVRAHGTTWPLPGTTWQTWWLDAARSGTGRSVNDGSLSRTAPSGPTTQSWLALPSLPTATDPHSIATLGVFGTPSPLTDMSLAEPLGLSYTTPVLRSDVVAVGPASLDLRLSSTAPSTDLLVVLSDVAPDGTAHPVATGRLRTSFPGIDRTRSLVLDDGRVVQPYGRYDRQDPAAIGQERRYHVELWPIGNRFRSGHRLRVHLLGTSLLSLPDLPALDTVRVGGAQGARLYLPVAPASALGPR
jgi:predicted acyl esterase